MSVDAINGTNFPGDPAPIDPVFSKDRLSNIASRLSDKNPDGAAALKKITDNFSAVDKNGDGKASLSELRDYAQQNNIELPKGIGGHHGHGRHKVEKDSSTQAATVGDLQNLRSHIAASGKDTPLLDNLITNFDAADTNQDGTVDLSELNTFLDKSKAQTPPSPDPLVSALSSDAPVANDPILQTYTAGGVVEPGSSQEGKQIATV